MSPLTIKDVDFGKTSKDYAAHRAGFPESFFTRLAEAGWMKAAKDVLDIGTGTGTLARGFARRGFTVTGLDASDNQITAAKELDAEAGIHVEYIVSAAEKTPLPDQSFDIITAGQCWHWLDTAVVVTELQRLLRPNGKIIIAYFDWIHEEGNPVDVMAKLREKYNPGWKGEFPLGFYPQGPGQLSLGSFNATDSFMYRENIPYTHEGWRGRMRAYAGIGGSLPPAQVHAFDVEFTPILKQAFPEAVMQVPHKIWAEVFELPAL